MKLNVGSLKRSTRLIKLWPGRSGTELQRQRRAWREGHEHRAPVPRTGDEGRARAQLCPPRTRRHSPTPHSPAAGSTLPKGAGARASRGQSSDPAEMLPSGQGRTPEVCARVKATWAGQGAATPGSQPPAPCEMTSCHLGRPPEASCHEQTKTNAVSAGSTIQVKWPIP